MPNGRSEQAMTLSVLEIFTIGVGPPRSHTVADAVRPGTSPERG